MVEEIDAAYGVGEQVEHGHGYQSAVETVAVVPAAEGLAAVAVVPVKWRGAEEAFEACFADVVVAFVVDVPLVIVEEGEFLFGEVVWFQGYGEDVLGWDVRFDSGRLGLVDGGKEVEVVLLLLFAAVNERVTNTMKKWYLTYALLLGYLMLASLIYFSPSTYRFHRLSDCL